MKTRVFFALGLIFFLGSSACSGLIEQLTVTPPSRTDTDAGSTACVGRFTGIGIELPGDDWTCSVNTEDNTNESFLVESPLFIITISTLGRGLFCENPGQDDSCQSTPFYENNSIALSTWSSYGEIKEIYGVMRLKIDGQFMSVHFSIKYQGMEHRALNPDEKQDLIEVLDSITFSK